jgi:hypothetical protein
VWSEAGQAIPAHLLKSPQEGTGRHSASLPEEKINPEISRKNGWDGEIDRLFLY